MQKKKLGVAVIGLGVGEQHLIAFRKSKYVKEIYIYDQSRKKMCEIKSKYKNIEICEDLEQIYKNPNIDIVSIASYDQYHFEQIYNSLRNDKHVFCEKPICQNESQLRKIENLLKRKKN